MELKQKKFIDGGYVKIILIDKTDFRECKSFIRHLIKGHISINDLPVLIDMHGVECYISLFEIFSIAKYLTSFQCILLNRIYIVVSDGRSLVTARFLQECLNSRGVDIHVSSMMDDVNEWLSHSVC